MTLKTFTIENIRSFVRCGDINSLYLPENWEGNVLDFLEHKVGASAQDKLWIVLREELLSPDTLRLFAISCVRKARGLLREDRFNRFNKECIYSIDLAEKLADKIGVEKGLSAGKYAWDSAWNAVWAVACADASDDDVTIDVTIDQLEMLIKIIKDEEKNQNDT